MQGESFTSQSGANAAFHAPAQGGATAGYVNDSDWAGYAQVSTAGRTQFSARVASGTSGGTIQVRSGSAGGPLLGSVKVPTTAGWTSYHDLTGRTPDKRCQWGEGRGGVPGVGLRPDRLGRAAGGADRRQGLLRQPAQRPGQPGAGRAGRRTGRRCHAHRARALAVVSTTGCPRPCT
ncbi:carbohydrate-binding protein [Micromonospora maritima]|uniref:carbohydrate-binding protein n=1 Tax=Micromonospora maritima TaxID=986711 RepID=UPI00157BB9A0|nr:carbohydrate-binding protein [Micromonospora maritima]